MKKSEKKAIKLYYWKHEDKYRYQVDYNNGACIGGIVNNLIDIKLLASKVGLKETDIEEVK